MKTEAKRQKAVALKYIPKSDNAPTVVAKGTGNVAEKILAIAKENNIYIQKDPDLLEILSRLDLHEEIPPELYVVVAELLSFVYALNRGEKHH